MYLSEAEERLIERRRKEKREKSWDERYNNLPKPITKEYS